MAKPEFDAETDTFEGSPRHIERWIEDIDHRLEAIEAREGWRDLKDIPDDVPFMGGVAAGAPVPIDQRDFDKKVYESLKMAAGLPTAEAVLSQLRLLVTDPDLDPAYVTHRSREVIRAYDESIFQDEKWCDHDWQDATNEIVKGGWYCSLCGAVSQRGPLDE